MHEVSLARNMLSSVEEAVRREGGGTVKVVHCRIGELAGVSVDALSFAFDVLSRGTPAEGGRIECERIPLRTRCRDCGKEFAPGEVVLACPACGGRMDIRSGREMEVDYILMDEE
ncbi:MAG TPA: hydrogenase maturation nickel metallochaperone HypA, partial [Candidatus Eisenbacteria bacterium]|nr:hydrogenase maturation nickel metallochaperone HypA [Candidatus Eisenbacteria bacterium]